MTKFMFLEEAPRRFHWPIEVRVPGEGDPEM